MARVTLDAPNAQPPKGGDADKPPALTVIDGGAEVAATTDEFVVPVGELTAEEVQGYLKDFRNWSDVIALYNEATPFRAQTDGGKARLQPAHLMLALLSRKGVQVTEAQQQALFACVESAERNAGAALAMGKGTSPRSELLFVEMARAAKGGAPTVADLEAVLAKSQEPDALKYRELLAKWSLRDEVQETRKEVQELQKLDLEMLGQIGEDMTVLASQGAYDEIIGRDEEIAGVYRTLRMRKLNSLVLTGEKGVGKTSIAEGIAQEIVRGLAPPPFENARLIATTPDKLLSAAAGGSLTQVLEKIAAEIKEAREQDPSVEVVLVIDEIHNLASDDAVRAGLPELIKPYLSSGRIRVLGLTTDKGYDQKILKGDIDGALADRLPRQAIQEPTREVAVEMVLKNVDRVAEYYGVEIDRGAVLTAVELGRYADMRQPRAGAYWLEQACAMVQDQLNKEPSAIRLVRMELEQVEDALLSLQRDESPEAQRSREMFEKMKAGLTQELTQLSESALKEKDLLTELQAAEAALGVLLDSDETPREELAKAREEVGRIARELQALPKRLYFRKVDSAAVAAVVSLKTGKSLDALSGDDSKSILELEAKLKARVIGQDEAVDSVVRAVKRDRVKMRDPNKPIETHFWPGQTGTGKTELAKALAEYAYDGKLIRIDCNEMMQQHELAKIMGAPPGYVGYDGGSLLAREVRANGGRCVLFFDEAEKAHKDFWKRIMQILDEGRLRDNDGTEVDLREVHIIMASNLGSDIFEEHARDGFYADEAAMLQKFEDVYKEKIPPEGRARIKHRTIFKPHSRDGIGKIFDVQFRRSSQRLKDEHGITMGCSDALKEKIIREGFVPSQGARLLNTTLENMLTDPIVDELFKRMGIAPKKAEGDEAANEDEEQPKVLFWRGAYVMADLDDQGALTFREMDRAEKAAAQKKAG